MRDRRKFLVGLGTAGTIAIAGCSRADPEPENGNVDDTEAEATDEAVFEIVETDDGVRFPSSAEQDLGGVVENTGSVTDEKLIELYDSEDNLINDGEVELEPGETYNARVTFDPDAFDPGEYTATLTTEDDSETFSFTVENGDSSDDDN